MSGISKRKLESGVHDQSVNSAFTAAAVAATAAVQSHTREGEEANQEIVDVDFEFFNFAEIDYSATSLLLRQLFSHDAVLFDIPALTSFVLDTNSFGSTVKCDGEQSDPYAICTALNLGAHHQNPAVAQLTSYLLSKISSDAQAKPIDDLLSACSSSTASLIGLILNERLINMPPQITAPLLRILGEEAVQASSEGKPFNFTHLLFFTRIFVPSTSDSQEDVMMAEQVQVTPATKKSKKKKGQSVTAAAQTIEQQYYSYHPEDEVIQRFATCTADFAFTNAPERDDKDAFGVETKARLLLVPYDRLSEVVAALEAEG